MLSTRSSTLTTGSGLSEAEKITLYVVAALGAVLVLLGIVIGILRSRHQKACRQQARSRSLSILKSMPIIQYRDAKFKRQNISQSGLEWSEEVLPDLETASTGSRYSTCPICTEDFVQNQLLRILPCQHQYHMECIKDWLVRSSSCPVW